jgi:Flp pilus assembly protein TadD
MNDIETALKMEPNNPVAYMLRGSEYSNRAYSILAQDDFSQAARIFQSEGDVNSYNMVMKLKADDLGFDARVRSYTAPVIVGPPSAAGGGFHDSSSAVTPY